MILRYCFQRHISPSKDARLIYQHGGIDGAPSFQGGAAEEMESFRNWKEATPGAQELFDLFANRSDITIQDVGAYADAVFVEKGGAANMTQFEREIRDTIAAMNSNPDPQKAIEAETRIQKLVDALNSRSKVIEQAQLTRGAFQKEQEIPTLTSTVFKTGKDVIGATLDGYNNSTGKEKMIMVAGLISGALMVRWAWSKIGLKGSFVKGSIGLVATLMGFEAVNKAVEKARGVPLLSWNKDGSFTTVLSKNNDYKNQKKNILLDGAYKELEKAGVPGKFLQEIGLQGKSKEYAIGINNLADLSVDQFKSLYEAHKGAQRVEQDASNYSLSATTEDQLTPAERYFLIFDVGQTLGLIDANGNFVEPKEPERRNKNLLYLMLDWKN